MEKVDSKPFPYPFIVKSICLVIQFIIRNKNKHFSAFWKQACEYVMDVRRAPAHRSTVVMGRKSSIYEETPISGNHQLLIKEL